MTQATLIAMLHERGLEVRVPQQDVASRVWLVWAISLIAWESSLLFATRLLHVLLLQVVPVKVSKPIVISSKSVPTLGG